MGLEWLQKSNSMEIKLQSEICLVTPPEFRFWQWWKWILILFSKTQIEINRFTKITAFTESVYHLQNFLTTVKSLIQTFSAANKNEEENVSDWLFGGKCLSGNLSNEEMMLKKKSYNLKKKNYKHKRQTVAKKRLPKTHLFLNADNYRFLISSSLRPFSISFEIL